MRKPEIHPNQANILLVLASRGKLKFSELNTNKLQNDWFSFHIRNLKKKNLIIKNSDGMYELTTDGKTLSLKINEQDLVYENNQRISVEIILKYKGKFLFQKRLKEPYFDYYEFPTERVRWGESPIECAKRCLENECGLTAEFEFKGINHKLDLDDKKLIIDDKYLLVFKAKYISGDLKKSFNGGTNMWLSKEEIFNLKKVHFDLKNVFSIYEGKKFLTDISQTSINY